MGILSRIRGTLPAGGGQQARTGDPDAGGDTPPGDAPAAVVEPPPSNPVETASRNKRASLERQAAVNGWGRLNLNLTGPFQGLKTTRQPDRGQHFPRPEQCEAIEDSTEHIAYAPQYFEKVPIHIEPNTLRAVTQSHGERFQFALLEKSGIALTGEKRPGNALLDELKTCGNRLVTVDNPDADAARVPLLLGLQRACHDSMQAIGAEHIDETDVTRALAYLREQNLYTSITNVDATPPNPPLDDAERRARDLAWRLVYKLAITESGMDVLYGLTDTPKLHADKATNELEQCRLRRQHLNLKHFFTAADTMLDEHAKAKGRPFKAEPANLLRHCCRQCEKEVAPKNTLLFLGLPAIQKKLCDEEGTPENPAPKSFWQKRIDRTERLLANNKVNKQQIATIRMYGDLFDEDFTNTLAAEVDAKFDKLTELLARQKAAMDDRFAFKWVSDGHFSNAPGSMLGTVEERCQKVEKYKERRKKRNARTPLEKVKRVKEITTGSKKTIFPPTKKKKQKKTNPESILLHREKMKSALEIFEELLMRDIGNTPDFADPITMQKMGRLALIRRWKGQLLRHMSSGIKPAAFDIEMLTSPDNLHNLFGEHPALAAEGNERDVFIANFKNALPELALTPQTLQEWGKMLDQPLPDGLADPVPDPLTVPPPVPLAEPLPDPAPDVIPVSDKTTGNLHTEITQHLQFLMEGWKSSLQPTGDPVQDFINETEEEILNMRLGNQHSISDGAIRGLNLVPIIGLLTRIKTMGTGALLIGPSASHRKMLNLEYGIASWGGFIRITSSGEGEGKFNLGGKIGPAGAGFAAGVEASYSRAGSRGYCFCIPRVGPEHTGQPGRPHGIEGDAQVAIEMAKIWKILTNTSINPEGEEGESFAMPILQEICEKVPEASVSLLGPEDTRSSEWAVTPSGGAYFGELDTSKRYGFGASLFASGKHSRKTIRYRQPKGALRVDTTSHTVRNSLSLGFRAPVFVGASGNGGTIASFAHGVGQVKALGLAAAGAVSEIGRSGKNRQINRIIHEGEIQRYSYRQTVRPRAKEFIADIENNMTKWANYFASHDPECPKEDDLPSDKHVGYKDACIDMARKRKLLVEKHAKIIRAYLKLTKDEVHVSDQFTDFYELTPEASKLLNSFYQREIEYRAAGCDAQADECKRAYDAIWQHEGAWAPYYFVTRNVQEDSKFRRFDFLLVLGSEHPNITTTLPRYV